MLKQSLNILACTACREPLQTLQTLDKLHDGDRLVHGALECPKCALWIPVVQGFALFSEAMPGGTPDLAERLGVLQRQLAGSADYSSFVHNRHARRIPDRYAAFQPFNESTRAFYALFDLIHAELKPGDMILDTWGRTGWSGEMLAAAFPEQHVVSIWEGNFDVLGYTGYAYWLPYKQRAANHDIVFVDANAGLPFLNQQFKLVHGLDSLHRYTPSIFGDEVLRTARDDGMIVFPHVHLANSQPQPFFERGGWQFHGHAYQQRFELAPGRQGRVVIVASEIDLFDAVDVLHTDPATPHYNGVVALVPPQWIGAPLRIANLDICQATSRAVLNPLLLVNSVGGCAMIDSTALSGLMDELLIRHPCYTERLAGLGQQTLSTTQLQMLFHLKQQRTLGEVAQRLALPFDTVATHAANMVRQELLQLAPISGAMSRLQAYYSDQIVHPLPAEETFEYLWQLVPSLYGERPLLVSGVDGSAFGWTEVDVLVSALQRGLIELGVKPGDRIVMLTSLHPEAMLLSWAAWRNGSVVVPLRKELAEAGLALAELLENIGPALLIVDRPRAVAANVVGCPVLLLDDLNRDSSVEAQPFDLPEFADKLASWLNTPSADEGNSIVARPVLPDDPAVILFTSGSTGQAKGVVLSQRALLKSGQLAATEFGWHSKDTLLSLGDFHTMSGLRNPAVGALFAGATVYIQDEAERMNVSKTLDAIACNGVTLLATGPAWLAMLQTLPAHLTLHPASLRQILSTGATLQSSVHAALCQRMDVEIIDYYGLTETGGLCLIFDHSGAAGQSMVSGRSIGAVMQICDATGTPVAPGVSGELRVHSNQLMSAYWRNPVQTSAMLRDGWLYTGDIASYDAFGQITLLGRRDDQLKNEYGEIVYPSHLERVISDYPHVSEVAVSEGPQGLMTLLVTSEGFDLTDFVAFCRQNMAANQLPREIRQLPFLLKTAAGKLDRRHLAKLAHTPKENQ